MGGYRGPPLPRPRAGRAAAPSSSASFGASSRWACGGTIRSGRQLFNPAVTVRLANEDVRRFDGRGKESARRFTREARRLRGHRAAARAGVGPRDRRRRPGVGRARPRQPLDRRRRGPRHRLDPAARASVPGGAAMDWDVPAGGPGGRGNDAARRRPRIAADPARLGRRAAPPARLSPGRGRRLSRAITSASAAATGRRCWACSSPSRSRARCSRESSWPAAGLDAASRPLSWRWVDRRACAPASGRRRRSGRCGSSTDCARGRDALFVRLGRWF